MKNEKAIYVNYNYEVDPSYVSTSRYMLFGSQFKIKDSKNKDRTIQLNKSKSGKPQTRIIKDDIKNKITWSIPKNMTFSKRGDDIYYIVEKSFEGRPDKIAMKFYGNPRYDWVFLYANNIQEPIQELISGKVLRIPSLMHIN